MGYQHINVPQSGDKITVNSDFSINVPNNPVIPFIEGDGIGVDITPVMIKVIDAAVAKAYDDVKKISWMEVYCGEKAADLYEGDWFPAETLSAVQASNDYALLDADCIRSILAALAPPKQQEEENPTTKQMIN